MPDTAPNPQPNSLAARDVAYSLHPYTNLAAHQERGPLVIVRGEGVHVFDEDGKEYIDALAGLWCTSLGFSEPRLVAAAKAQLEILPFSHSFAHRAHPPTIELAEKLMEIAPEPLARPFFVNSGSEAVETAIKIVWYYQNALGRPEKKKIVGRNRGYHGVMVASGSLTAIPPMQNDFDLPFGGRFLKVSTPCHYRYAEPGEDEAAFADRLAAELEELIEAEGADTIAAFIAEPVMAGGGAMPPPDGYFEKIQAVLKRHDILFIADEVVCGFGRTGNMWGSETYGIRPDLLTCAKALSSGYLPIGATLVSGEIYETLVDQSRKHGIFGIGMTYGGHPVCAAVALETLKIYRERDTLGHVRAVAPRFQKRVRELGSHPLVGDARGVGLIAGLEVVKDKATKESYPAAMKVGAMLVDKGAEAGFLTRPLPSDTLGICPPLIITEAEIDELFGRIADALDATKAALDRL
jgi:4-aminobutyrate--pyruvate transaminase